MTSPLLPAGCYDTLFPYAAKRRKVLNALMEHFARSGYQEVHPSLMEYTETLLSGRGAALAEQTLRIMDPDAKKVMGLRPDMTLQITRIAATRLKSAARPLKLAYGGEVLRVGGQAGAAQRQFLQAGVELIGDASAQAEAEVIRTGIQALEALGFRKITLDLTMPGLLEALCHEQEINPAMRSAVRQKNLSGVRAQSPLLAEVLVASGEAKTAIATLEKLSLPKKAAAYVMHVKQLLNLLANRLPENILITLDPLEGNALDYHTGIGFSYFAAEQGLELGRGGRYRLHENGEEAVGFSFNADQLAEYATQK